MEYLNELLWHSSWPIVIILSVKFVELNLSHYNKMEKLEEFEALESAKV